MNPPDRAVALSIDGKTRIQALARTRKGLPMKPGRPATMTHDYKRHGATNLFAALNILDGKAAGLAIHAILDTCAAHKHGAVGEWLADHPRWTLGPLNYAAFRRFRDGSRRRPARGSAARSRAKRAGMRRPGPVRRARSAERGVPRIRIVPTAGNRAQKAAASRFRLIAAAVK